MGSLHSVELKEGSNMRNGFEKKVQRSQYLAGKCDAHVVRQSAIHLPRRRSLCCSAGRAVRWPACRACHFRDKTVAYRTKIVMFVKCEEMRGPALKTGMFLVVRATRSPQTTQTSAASCNTRRIPKHTNKSFCFPVVIKPVV